jgi:hypothetical protein
MFGLADRRRVSRKITRLNARAALLFMPLAMRGRAETGLETEGLKVLFCEAPSPGFAYDFCCVEIPFCHA